MGSAMNESMASVATGRPGPSSLYLPLRRAQQMLPLEDQARNMGIAVLAGRGAGKSTLMSLIAFQDALRSVPLLVLDPVGSVIQQLIWLVMRLPEALQRWFWEHTILIDAAGRGGHVVASPAYYRLGEESFYEVAQRPLDLYRKLEPAILEAPILGWGALHRTGSMVGMLLAAGGYQLTEAPDLLLHPEGWRSRIGAAVRAYPEIAPAREIFESYCGLKEPERARLRDTFLTQVLPITLEPTLRAMLGASTPGIDWKAASNRGMKVLIDFSGVHDIVRKRFLMWHWFGFFLSYIKKRGQGRHRPWSVIVDELTAFLNFQATSDTFVQELDYLINVLSRSHQLWLTIGLQEAWQVAERIAQGLLTMGTLLLGRTTDPQSAEWLAQHVYRYDPTKIRKRQPVWMSDMMGPYIVDWTTEEFDPPTQVILNSYTIADLPAFTFLARPARAEGTIENRVWRISLRRFIDKNFWPDQALVEAAKTQLRARTGIPVATLLGEIQARLEKPSLTTPKGETPAASLDSQKQVQSDPASAILDTNSPPPYDATQPLSTDSDTAVSAPTAVAPDGEAHHDPFWQ